LKGLFLGETVKGYIQLYRIKKSGVEFEPLFLRKVRGIEDPIPPMRIVITARPDVNHN
jgi:UDP-glucose 6-dehydrogenase